jgi:hypothetical protein
MGKLLSYILIAMVSVFSLMLLNKYALSKPLNIKGTTILVMPKIYMYAGYAGTLFFVVLVVGSFITEGYDPSMLPYLILYPFMIGGGIITILTYHLHYVVFDENTISSTNIFGKTNKACWNEISKISFNQFSSMIVLATKNGNKIKMHQHLKGVKIILNKVKELNVEIGKNKIPNY